MQASLRLQGQKRFRAKRIPFRVKKTRVSLLDKRLMKIIRPANTDPIPLRNATPPIGTVMLRFAGILILASIVLAVVWLR
jgi:hypothetical protein